MMQAEPLVVVCDTNALLPLLVGRTRRALSLQQAWQDKRFVLVVTPPILEELTRVMQYPRVGRSLGLTRRNIDEALCNLRRRARNLPGLYEGVTTIQDDLSDNITWPAPWKWALTTWSVRMPIFSISNTTTALRSSPCPSLPLSSASCHPPSAISYSR